MPNSAPKFTATSEVQQQIRNRILECVTRHSHYPLELFNICCKQKELSYIHFKQLLVEMQADGGIEINANNRVLLPPEPSTPENTKPHPAIQPPNPAEILIDCLVNCSRSLKVPADKKSCKGQYYSHRNYTTEKIPLEAFGESTLVKGYHVVPGTFEALEKQTSKCDGYLIEKKFRVTDRELISEVKYRDNKKEMREGASKTEIVIRDGDAWQEQQLFFVEFDDTNEKNLPDFIEAHPFIKKNAWGAIV